MDQAKTKEILRAIGEIRDAYNKLDRILSSGPASYYFKGIEDCIDGLFSYAKFKEGDIVELVRDIDCSDKPGWGGCEHFLKAGSRASIDEVNFIDRSFRYGVQFENESWIDQDKVIRPVKQKHQFWMRESNLRLTEVK